MKQSISKEFFLHLGLIASLYATVTSLMIFTFAVINLQFPDTLNNFNVSSIRSQMSFSLSLLIVTFPIFVVLSRKIYKDLDNLVENRELWIRKWFLSLTIFLLVLMFAITIVTLIYTFLSGEITTRFSLKVIATLLISSFSFWFYLKDYQGYFFQKPKVRKNIINITTAVVSFGILIGLALAGSPGENRSIKLDEKRVSNLIEIQREITVYWQNNDKLPEELEDISSPITFFNLPKDPETEKDYTYKVLSDTKFQLCANFTTSTIGAFRGSEYEYLNREYWEHKSGVHCFDREIDEALIVKPRY